MQREGLMSKTSTSAVLTRMFSAFSYWCLTNTPGKRVYLHTPKKSKEGPHHAPLKVSKSFYMANTPCSKGFHSITVFLLTTFCWGPATLYHEALEPATISTKIKINHDSLEIGMSLLNFSKLLNWRIFC